MEYFDLILFGRLFRNGENGFLKPFHYRCSIRLKKTAFKDRSFSDSVFNNWKFYKKIHACKTNKSRIKQTKGIGTKSLVRITIGAHIQIMFRIK